MPFKSKKQLRKFYALKNKGEMSQEKIDEWTSETPKTKEGKLAIPEDASKKKKVSKSGGHRYKRKG